MNRSILIDADVISHFISGGKINLLPKIFPENKIFLIDKVYDEITRFHKKKPVINVMIRKGFLTILPFPEDQPEILKEYANIKKRLFKGDGESACMAVALYKNNIIASSNLKDIGNYCHLHSIDYLTTMDFLCAALNGNLLSIEECDEFISKVIRHGSKLPVLRMKSYVCRDLGFIRR